MIGLLLQLANRPRAGIVLTPRDKNLSFCDRLVVMGRGVERKLLRDALTRPALLLRCPARRRIYRALKLDRAAEWACELYETASCPSNYGRAPDHPPADTLPRRAAERFCRRRACGSLVTDEFLLISANPP